MNFTNVEILAAELVMLALCNIDSALSDNLEDFTADDIPVPHRAIIAALFPEDTRDATLAYVDAVRYYFDVWNSGSTLEERNRNFKTLAADFIRTNLSN